MIGLSGAQFLFEALVSQRREAFENYQHRVVDQLKAWEHIVDQFYNGRFFTVMEAGEEFKKTIFGTLVSRHVHRHVARVMTGTATTVPYSRGLLSFLFKHGLRKGNPEDVRIH